MFLTPFTKYDVCRQTQVKKNVGSQRVHSIFPIKSNDGDGIVAYTSRNKKIFTVLSRQKIFFLLHFLDIPPLEV